MNSYISLLSTQHSTQPFRKTKLDTPLTDQQVDHEKKISKIMLIKL